MGQLGVAIRSDFGPRPSLPLSYSTCAMSTTATLHKRLAADETPKLLFSMGRLPRLEGQAMAVRILNAVRCLLLNGLVASTLSTFLAGCNQRTEAAAPELRPVRTVTVEKREAGTGHADGPH